MRPYLIVIFHVRQQYVKEMLLSEQRGQGIPVGDVPIAVELGRADLGLGACGKANAMLVVGSFFMVR
jgi:hypothetical protein